MKLKNKVAFWIIESICLLIILYEIINKYFILGFIEYWSHNKSYFFFVTCYHVFLICLIIFSIVFLYKYKKYGKKRFILNIIVIVGLLYIYFPWSSIGAAIKFQINKKDYLEVIQQYKNNQLMQIPKRGDDELSSNKNYELLPKAKYLSLGGTITVRAVPLTVFFDTDNVGENFTGIAYCEGPINEGSIEDPTNLVSFLHRNYEIWRLQGNWYVIETYISVDPGD
jgi:hypothetical protein